MPAIKLISFGYSSTKDGHRGMADRVEDVRSWLRDPAAAGDVLDLDGRDPRVQDIVLNTPGARDLLDNLVDYASLAAGPAVRARHAGAASRPCCRAITGSSAGRCASAGSTSESSTATPTWLRERAFTGGSRHVAEALCMTYDADWETIAKKLGGQLRNREVADTGEYDTLLVASVPPVTPEEHRPACAVRPATTTGSSRPTTT